MRHIITQAMLILAIGFANTGNLNAQFCTGGYTDSIDSLTVYFTNTATGNYNWMMYDFGDGNYVLNTPNPVHTYASSGFYQVCQIIQDSISGMCFDYICDTLIIGDATCMADFWWFPDGLEVEFWNYSLGDFDSLLWDFGDNTTSNDTFPIHTYASSGSYTVCLSLFDSTGTLCDSACQTIFVDSASCEADFSTSTAGLTANFTNQSLGNFNVVYWDFGDGFGSSEQFNPSYTYFMAGTYEVCLMIYDTLFGSCYDEICKNVTVTSGGGTCNASFTYVSDELQVVCTNTSTGNFITSFWDYGDGTSPTLNTQHTYAAPGTYDICLTIGNLVPFCADQHCETVTVTEFTCEPSFEHSYDPNTNVFNFTNTTTVGNVTSVLWEFGDGNTSTFTNPSYTYNLPGTYEVCLTTYDGANICGVACEDIEVYPLGESGINTYGMKVFPNPSNGNLLLTRGSVEGELHIVLLDIAGRKIAEQTSADQTVYLSFDVPAGMYLLRVSGEWQEVRSFALVIE